MTTRKEPPRRRRCSQPNISGPLVVVDAAPIRKTVLKGFLDQYTRFAKLRRRLVQHRDTDGPNYAGWFAVHFSDCHAKMAALKDELEEKGVFLEAVEYLVYLQGWSPGRALRHVTAQQEKALGERCQGEEAAEFAEEEGAGDFDPRFREGEDDDVDDDDPEAFFRMFADMLTGDGAGQRSNADGARAGRQNTKRERQRSKINEAKVQYEKELKVLYHQLAKVLHPDTGCVQHAHIQELWSEVQIAYRAHDLDMLHVLATLHQLQEKASGDVRVSSLMRLIQYLGNQTTHLMREKRRIARDDPAWNFGDRDSAKLEQKIRLGFAEAEAELQGALARIEARIDAFSRGVRRAEKSKRKTTTKKKAIRADKKAYPKEKRER